MSRKRHRTGLFNHAAATKNKCESEKGQVVPMSGSNLHIVLMLSGCTMPHENGLKSGFGVTSRTLQANNESMPPNVPDLAHHEPTGKGRADPGEIVNKFQFLRH